MDIGEFRAEVVDGEVAGFGEGMFLFLGNGHVVTCLEDGSWEV